MAADIELRMISRAIRDRNLAPLIDLGVDDSWFHGDDALQLWRFARDHHARYGECPTAVAVKDALQGYRLLRVDDALPYLIDSFMAFRRRDEAIVILQGAAELIEDGKHEAALALMMARGKILADAPIGSATVDPLGERLALMKFTARNGEDLDDLPMPDPLIEDTIDRNTIAFLFGWMGSGKTWTALDWAMHICNGLAWNGRPVKQGKVLYICAEGASGLRVRINAWKRRYGGDASNLTVKYVKVRLVEDAAVIAQWVKEEDYILVVIDTLARNKDPHLEENSPTDMGKMTNAADDIRIANGACVLVVHHTGKDKAGPRGSSTFECDADTIYKATLEASLLTLERTKRREGPQDDVVTMELVVDPAGGCHLDARTERVQERRDNPMLTMTPIERVLCSTYTHFATREVTRQDLLDRAEGPGVSRHHAVKMLTALVEKGLMDKRQVGRRAMYWVTAEGEARVTSAQFPGQHASSTSQSTAAPNVGCSPPPYKGGSTTQVHSRHDTDLKDETHGEEDLHGNGGWTLDDGLEGED